MSTPMKTSKLKSLDAVYATIEQAMATIVADIEANRYRRSSALRRPRRSARRTARAA